MVAISLRDSQSNYTCCEDNREEIWLNADRHAFTTTLGTPRLSPYLLLIQINAEKVGQQRNVWAVYFEPPLLRLASFLLKTRVGDGFLGGSVT